MEDQRKRQAEEERRNLEEKERVKREREEEMRKIEEAKKTIADSGKALGRNAGSAMVSSGGAGSATYTSEYTDNEIEEEKKVAAEPPKPATKQVDR